MSLPAPTDDVAMLCRLIGPEATLALVEARGGIKVYIPEQPAGSDLADIVGLDAAAKLSSTYARDWLRVPLARPWRILCYKAAGLSYKQIALKAGCTDATVWEVLKRLKASGAQGDLFKAS